MSVEARPQGAILDTLAAGAAARRRARGDRARAARVHVRRIVCAALVLLLAGCVPIGVRVQNMLALWQG